MRVFMTLSLALLLAGGCGMKGPLYLPEPDVENSAEAN